MWLFRSPRRRRESGRRATRSTGLMGPVPPAEPPLAGPLPFLLSARSEPALREAASRLAQRLGDDPETALTDIAYSLATTRSAFEHRAVAVGADREELGAALGALARGESSPDLHLARAREGKLAFLFSGQGSQRAAMGGELCECDPTYAQAFEQACEALDAELGESLAQIVLARGEEAAERLRHTTYAQPALFATGYALHAALTARGLRPDLLAGHSIGEILAAQIAGVFSLPDAARLVCARARLMGALPEGGAMLAVAVGEREAAAYVQGRESELSIAALNSPSSTVLSGSGEAIEAARSHFEAAGEKSSRLAVSHAFHSPLIEPMLAEFAELAQSLTYREPQIPVLSNLTGEPLSAAQATDPAYWVAHAREPVRFADATATLARLGAGVLIELGPDPVLLGMAEETLREQGAQAALVATLREGRPEPRALSSALAAAHAAGAAVEWEAFFAPAAPRRVALPTYPFQRERFWLASWRRRPRWRRGPRARPAALSRSLGADRGSAHRSLRGPWTLVVSPGQRDDPGIAAVEEALSSACADLARVELDSAVRPSAA